MNQATQLLLTTLAKVVMALYTISLIVLAFQLLIYINVKETVNAAITYNHLPATTESCNAIVDVYGYECEIVELDQSKYQITMSFQPLENFNIMFLPEVITQETLYIQK